MLVLRKMRDLDVREEKLLRAVEDAGKDEVQGDEEADVGQDQAKGIDQGQRQRDQEGDLNNPQDRVQRDGLDIRPRRAELVHVARAKRAQREEQGGDEEQVLEDQPHVEPQQLQGGARVRQRRDLGVRVLLRGREVDGHDGDDDGGGGDDGQGGGGGGVL